MRRARFAFLLIACGLACGSPPEPRAPDVPLVIAPLGPDAGAPAPLNPEPSLDLATFIASDAVHAVTDAHAGFFVNVAALRGHSLAPRFRETVRAKAPGVELFDDVDEVVIVGPDLARRDTRVVLVRARPGVDVPWNIERILRGASPLRAKKGDVVDIDGIRGWRAPDDRVALRVREDLVVVVQEERAAAAVASFRGTPLGVPPARALVGYQGDGEGARLGGLMPGGGTLEELRFVVEGRDDGGAELDMTARATNAADAAEIARNLNAIAGNVGGSFGQANATSDGTSVRFVVRAEERHVGAIVDVLAALPF